MIDWLIEWFIYLFFYLLHELNKKERQREINDDDDL